MRIVALQVGRPKTITWNEKEIRTSIFKAPVPGPVMLRTTNIDGDEQSDPTVHGGRDKALYAYGADAYAWWETNRPGTYEHGAFGENLTVDVLPEDTIHIGDVYDVGDAQVQVTEPRFPCYKLSAKFNDPTMQKTFMRSERSGVYFRVLREGRIAVGDTLRLTQRDPTQPTIRHAFLNRPKRK